MWSIIKNRQSKEIKSVYNAEQMHFVGYIEKKIMFK
jgi:hypothetical protein